ncbi:HTR-like protein [Haloarculaceae archaeon H-GB2-1]|nr:HTR-like protein [Haloarculaceae archaeon H-GB1-1]MEA5408507.1 HTR-like protein [Haloarculaceae archaeon H-GB2-1]
MERIPFGIRQLDSIVNGGAPRGSVVLLSGEAGAGSREFMYTSALMNGLAYGDEELHDLYYGDRAPNAALPNEVHYISFTSDQEQLSTEIQYTMESDIIENGLPAIQFHDLSEVYFHTSAVPREWYSAKTPTIKDLRARHERAGIMGSIGNLLTEHAPGNLVVIDSLTDLISAIGEDQDIEWSDVAFFLKGLQKAAGEWQGVILVHVNHETVTPERLGQLVDAAHGVMRFQWESGGSSRARTLVVKQFRGVLSQIEEENIVQFETEITDAGFDISDVRKIR